MELRGERVEEKSEVKWNEEQSGEEWGGEEWGEVE